MTRHKDGVCKFAVVIRLSCICVVNHELCASLLKEELQELDSVAAQAVFVQLHNFLYHSAQDAFQKGKNTKVLAEICDVVQSLPVGTITDATYDAMISPTPKRGGLRNVVALLNDTGRQILYTLTTLLLLLHVCGS